MNTRPATSRLSLQNEQPFIKGCKASGLKVDDYCNQHDLSRDVYYYWLWKVKVTIL